MKKYSTPNLTIHGNVESITQALGTTDKNDFLFFNGNAVPTNGNPITGDGSQDGNLNLNGTVTPRGTLRGK
jgi:hypothetical protein